MNDLYDLTHGGRRPALLSLVPGPTTPTDAVRAALAGWSPGAPSSHEYLRLHEAARAALAPLFGAPEGPVILAGPASLGPWAAVRSAVAAEERVLVLDTGPLSWQLADAAAAAGAVLQSWQPRAGDYPDLDELAARLITGSPDWVLLAHAEPERALQLPARELVRTVREHSGARVCLDARASLAAAPVEMAALELDLCLAAGDHALSLPVDVALVAVSGPAWERVAAVGYRGFEALGRWRDPALAPDHPYSPSGAGLAALLQAARDLAAEGLPAVWRRHEEVATYARDRLRRAELPPWPAEGLVASPAVSAIGLPPGIGWPELVAGLAERGVALGLGEDGHGSALALLGHMGSQAQLPLVKRGLDALVDALAALTWPWR